MMTQLFRTTLLLFLLMPFAAVPARAGRGAQINPIIKVNLQCTWNGPKEFVRVTVRNSTNSTIPQGKTIHWSVNSATKGSITLQNGLAPGQTIVREVPLSGNAPYTPQAWYWK